MLHLRVVCASTHTESVLDVLRTEPGIAHPVVFRGAARRPDGDVLEAEVAREGAQEVLRRLEALGVSRDGEISLQGIDLLLSDSVTRTERRMHGAEADGVIWDELVETTGDESRLNAVFLAFLTLACLLAAVGVLTDSAITIVGAMVVSPDFGPLAALAVALVGRRTALAAHAGLALGVGYPFAILVTGALALVALASGTFEPTDLDHLTAAAYIYRIGPYSPVIALLAGAAGMLALTSRKSGVLIGVFISVTTVPAAGFAALAAVAGHWTQCVEALLQLLINLAGVTAAGIVTLLVRRRQVLPALRPILHRRHHPSRSLR